LRFLEIVIGTQHHSESRKTAADAWRPSLL